jgi:hypothetical protein
LLINCKCLHKGIDNTKIYDIINTQQNDWRGLKYLSVLNVGAFLMSQKFVLKNTDYIVRHMKHTLRAHIAEEPLLRHASVIVAESGLLDRTLNSIAVREFAKNAILHMN